MKQAICTIKRFFTAFLDFYQEAPFPHVLGSICCSCPIDAEGGKLSFIFSKKYFNFIIFTKQTLSTMCKISSCVRATFSFCRSVRYWSIGVSPTHSKLYGTASPFLQCFARRESLLPQLRRDRSEFTGAGQVLLRLSSVHPESKAKLRCVVGRSRPPVSARCVSPCRPQCGSRCRSPSP